MRIVNLQENTTPLCRAALSELRFGSVSVRRIKKDVREVLEDRDLVWERTDGILELTPRGRGVDPGSFEA